MFTNFQLGTLVELRVAGGGGEAAFGVVRWRGHLHDVDEEAAGVELEEERSGGRFNKIEIISKTDKKSSKESNLFGLPSKSLLKVDVLEFAYMVHC